jgi:hypothetical protein
MTVKKKSNMKPVNDNSVKDKEGEIRDLLRSTRPGICYIIKERRTRLGFLIIREACLNDRKGLIITREYPDHIREEYGFKDIPIIWLTTNKTKSETVIGPMELAKVSAAVVSFLGGGENILVLIDGIEYLISQNDYRTVINLVQFLRDKIVTRKGILMISLDPHTLDKKELRLIEKEGRILYEEPDL